MVESLRPMVGLTVKLITVEPEYEAVDIWTGPTVRSGSYNTAPNPSYQTDPKGLVHIVNVKNFTLAFDAHQKQASPVIPSSSMSMNDNIYLQNL